MRKIVTLFALVGLFTACNCPEKQCDEQTAGKQAQNAEAPFTLVGKSAVLKYPSLTAEVEYVSTTEIHWKTTDDKGEVAEQTNVLLLKPISNTQFFLNWIENDDTTVSQVIDIEKKTVVAFLTYNESGRRVAQTLEGTFELK